MLTINRLFVFSIHPCCFDELCFDAFDRVGLLICIEMNSESINHLDGFDTVIVILNYEIAADHKILTIEGL